MAGPALIQYRPFRNSDPPQLASLWRAHSGPRGYLQPMSAALLEQFVFGKPYFDRLGLIVADDGHRIVGFAHAGFGPNEARTDIDTELGVTSMLITHPSAEPEVGATLLEKSEAYLRRRGARVLYAMEINPLNPFYMGLYGGSELPGALDSDPQTKELFLAHGYREIDRTVVLHRELGSFRPVIDRTQTMLRRKSNVEVFADPRTDSWWQACTEGMFERTEFVHYSRDMQGLLGGMGSTPHREGEAGGSRGIMPLSRAVFRNLDVIPSGWGVQSAGLIHMEVAPEYRGQDVGTFLLCEALRQLQEQGVMQVETQAMQSNAPALGLYRKLGFVTVDGGSVLRKDPS